MRHGKKTRPAIGFLTRNASFDSVGWMARGIRRMAEAEGVDFFHLSDLEQSETEGGRTRIRSEAASLRERYRLLGRYIRQFRLDGLIAVGWYLDREGAEPALLREAAGGLPIVSLGEEAADFPYVKVNGYRYWKQLTEHLIRDHGRRHVGFIMPLNGEDDRLAGYLDAMAEAGLSAGGLVAGSEELASAGEDFQERTRRGIDLLMTRSAHRLDALMLTTFTEGKIALDILRDKGIRVPDDLALVCYEDDDSLQFTDPPLTTVYFPFIECGMMAARKLIRLVRGEPVNRMDEAPARIIYRQSCGCTASGEDDKRFRRESRQIFHALSASNEMYQKLGHIGRSLLSVYTLPDILDQLNNHLGWLQIPSLYLFLGERDERRLVYASDNYRQVHPVIGEGAGEAEAAAWLANADRQKSLFVLPLYIDRHSLGSVWLDLGGNDLRFAIILLHYLKTAIHTAQLLEESRKLVSSLREENRLRREREFRLAELADTDGLTGLYNRRTFYGALEAACGEGTPFALLFFDMDGFKQVNDTHGHDFGDRLLIAVTGRLREALRHNTLAWGGQWNPKREALFRLGGDEFIALLAETDRRRLAAFTGRVLDRLNAPYEIDGREVRISCSVGISLFPETAEEGDVLLRQADAAMYRAKSLKNAFAFHAD